MHLDEVNDAASMLVGNDSQPLHCQDHIFIYFVYFIVHYITKLNEKVIILTDFMIRVALMA